MMPSSYDSGYSAYVHIDLIVDHMVFYVGQLGPDFLTLHEPVELPPTDAEIVMSIDGNVRRWNVYLPEGISAAKTRTKIA